MRTSEPGRARSFGCLFAGLSVTTGPVERPEEPRLGHLPIALGRLCGNAEGLRGFFDRQSPKIPALDDPRFARIGTGQCQQRLVERKHLDPMRLGACDRVFDRNVDDVATSLERFALASMVDENAPSDLRAEHQSCWVMSAHSPSAR